jgi:hypothetical protein
MATKTRTFLDRLLASRKGKDLLAALDAEETADREGQHRKAAQDKAALVTEWARAAGDAAEATAALRGPLTEAETRYREAESAFRAAEGRWRALDYSYQRRVAALDATMRETADPALVALLADVKTLADTYQDARWTAKNGASVLEVLRRMRDRIPEAMVDLAVDGAQVAAALQQELQDALDSLGDE